MKQFNKDNLKHIYKIDPKLVDMFNETMKKYDTPKKQLDYWMQISVIDKDFEDLKDIHYSSYLYELAKEPYSDLDALEKYHNAMLSINENNDYSDLYYVLKDNREVEDYVENYMSENEIYYGSELWGMIDEDLKTYGIESDMRYLIPSVEGNSAEYLKINAYGNDVDGYENMVEVFKEVYEDSFDIIDRYYFEELSVEPEPKAPGGKGDGDIEEPEM